MINRTSISCHTGTVQCDVLTVRYSSTRQSVSSTVKLDTLVLEWLTNNRKLPRPPTPDLQLKISSKWIFNTWKSLLTTWMRCVPRTRESMVLSLEIPIQILAMLEPPKWEATTVVRKWAWGIPCTTRSGQWWGPIHSHLTLLQLWTLPSRMVPVLRFLPCDWAED